MPRAQVLAQRYRQVVTAMREAHAFDTWLDRHWQERCPVRRGVPAARTTLDPEGTVVEWYETEAAVYGFVAGYSGCYRLGLADEMPAFPAPLRSEQTAAAGEDLVVRAAQDVVLDVAYAAPDEPEAGLGWALAPATARRADAAGRGRG